MFSASDVKELRERTGAGMLDCKKALDATKGDMDKAIDWLREKGISKAAKKEARIAAEGLSEIEIKGNKAVILEVNSETDFVAKNSEFTTFVKDVADAILNSDAKTMEEALELDTENGKIKDYDNGGTDRPYIDYLKDIKNVKITGEISYLGKDIFSLLTMKMFNEQINK